MAVLTVQAGNRGFRSQGAVYRVLIRTSNHRAGTRVKMDVRSHVLATPRNESVRRKFRKLRAKMAAKWEIVYLQAERTQAKDK